ncbi:MAG: hypothetical protein PHX87_00295 [Candidatus Peribacteraceae bacterium]|nr:hypothetical protein [Candidatus Peribacteraceae bacterium]MDD5741848.1 hypothetical protein [Candidatus Peribacteraceae bacterium]
MEQSPRAPKEFAILTPEAAQREADILLKQALAAVREVVETCLHGIPAPRRRLAKPVRVGGTVFRVPDTPSDSAEHSLSYALQAVFGSKTPVGIQRAEVSTEAIARHAELFAALYAWGYLYPEEEWEDVIQWEPEPPCTASEANRRDILQVFTGFAHGSDGDGIAFQSGDQRMCFNPAYQGRVARVIADCMEVAPQDICRLERMEVVHALLETYPQLGNLFPDPGMTLEAMVEIVQKGESAA